MRRLSTDPPSSSLRPLRGLCVRSTERHSLCVPLPVLEMYKIPILEIHLRCVSSVPLAIGPIHWRLGLTRLSGMHPTTRHAPNVRHGPDY